MDRVELSRPPTFVATRSTGSCARRKGCLAPALTAARLVVSVVELPVDGGPEVEIDPGGPGGGEALGHQDPDHVLLGVRRPGRAQAALPPITPGRGRYAIAAGYGGQAEPPAALPQEGGDGVGARP